MDESTGLVTREVSDGRTTFVVVENPGDGPTLSYSPDSGVELLSETVDGVTYAFKDMNANGTLDTWEDWREASEDRAAALVEEVSIEQIAGLTLFSSHERSPADGLTDAQKTYLSESNLRNVLNAGGNDVEDQVTWSNAMQAYAESLAGDDPYIPINFSSDPRSSVSGGTFAEVGTTVSEWPSNLGLAATFDPDTVLEMAQMISQEYRALGIQTALGPQIDLVTDPRWSRNNGTFGEDIDLAGQMASAYVDGIQNTYDENGESIGWGDDSVAAEIKHFPGDGAGEGGREAHFNRGKFAVYPGGNTEGPIEVFDAAMDSASVMMSYSIGVAADGSAAFGDLVGSAYDKEKIALLRDAGYEGVIVTDWMVTKSGNDEGTAAGINTAWGAEVEAMTVDERHYALLDAGIDMYGGNNDVVPVLAAYDLWQEAYENGEQDIDADTRFRETGERILNMIIKTGAYENPYVDLEASQSTVGDEEKMTAGQEAQLNSIVMLKNDGGTVSAADAADWADKTVYIPQSYDLGAASAFAEAEYTEGPTLDLDLAASYFATVVTDEVEYDADGTVVSYTAPDLSDVDLVLVGMDQPSTGNGEDAETGEYIPISLQYRPYTADGENVRQVSIAGDILDDGSQENRSYYGQTTTATNESQLDALERAVAAVEASGKDIPVVTVLRATSGIVPAEFERLSDAIVVGFGVADEALFEVTLGLHEPAGRLPIGFPDSMDSVEASFEDVPKDHGVYVDSVGNSYEFGFGLNWSGVIND